MKKMLFAAFMAVLSVNAVAQNDPLQQIRDIAVELNEHIKSQRYSNAVECLDELEAVYNSLPDSLQVPMDMSGVYYNRACCLSLLRKKRRALDDFDRYAQAVIGKREIDYGRILKDTDFDNIRNEKRFVATLQRLARWADYRSILQEAPGYDNAAVDSLPTVRYANPNDTNLVKLRTYYNLDSIAGAGDELSKIINLMTWVHNTVRHDGSSPWPARRTAMGMIAYCRENNCGVNCRMMALILNECYLSMGFKSRYVTCMPKTMVNDCHVINAVYSATLDKWLWMDPTFNAYVTDSLGTPLSIAEVRERIRENGDYHISDNANWNNEKPYTTEEYLHHYMAKNLYYLEIGVNNIYGAEWPHDGYSKQSYVVLKPAGDPGYEKVTSTTNEQWFWRSPYE